MTYFIVFCNGPSARRLNIVSTAVDMIWFLTPLDIRGLSLIEDLIGMPNCLRKK